VYLENSRTSWSLEAKAAVGLDRRMIEMIGDKVFACLQQYSSLVIYDSEY
jgi:hypothetical protein